MNYSEKLKDPRWQRKRLEILQRDDFTCQVCFDKETTLHVHHKYYEKGKDPWDYENKHLITLCEGCHEYEEESLKEYSDLFIQTFRKSPFMAGDLFSLAGGIFHLDPLPHVHHVVASAYEFAMKDKRMQQLIIDEYFKDCEERRKNEPNFLDEPDQPL